MVVQELGQLLTQHLIALALMTDENGGRSAQSASAALPRIRQKRSVCSCSDTAAALAFAAKSTAPSRPVMAEELPGISFEESLDLFIYFSCRNFWRVSFCVSLCT